MTQGPIFNEVDCQGLVLGIEKEPLRPGRNAERPQESELSLIRWRLRGGANVTVGVHGSPFAADLG